MVSRLALHPSFPDRENFGRSAMQLPPETVYAQTLYQIGALATIARAQGGVMRQGTRHVIQPGGERGSTGRRHRQSGIRLRSGIYFLVGLAGSELIRAGKQYGLTTREEVFADRGYQATARWCREASQAR